LACAVLLFCILILHLRGFQSPNLEFVTIGLLGVLVGFVPIEKINNAVGHAVLLTIAYVFYIIAIRAWNVPFPLLILGAVLSVGAIYLVGLRADRMRAIGRHVALLGKYSLFGYIAQIAILQLLSAGLRRADIDIAVLMASFVAAVGLTLLTVEGVDRVKTRSMVVDRLYKTVFA